MTGFVELTPKNLDLPRFILNKDFIVYAHEDTNAAGGTVIHLREGESWSMHGGQIGTLHIGEIGSPRITVKEDYEDIKELLSSD